jgi:hypothetical protein
MASAAFLFALLAGVSMATYTVFLRLASPGIHPALGAAIITGVALLVNASLTLTMKAIGAPITFTSKSIYLVDRRYLDGARAVDRIRATQGTFHVAKAPGHWAHRGGDLLASARRRLRLRLASQQCARPGGAVSAVTPERWLGA